MMQGPLVYDNLEHLQKRKGTSTPGSIFGQMSSGRTSAQLPTAPKEISTHPRTQLNSRTSSLRKVVYAASASGRGDAPVFKRMNTTDR